MLYSWNTQPQRTEVILNVRRAFVAILGQGSLNLHQLFHVSSPCKPFSFPYPGRKRRDTNSSMSTWFLLLLLLRHPFTSGMHPMHMPKDTAFPAVDCLLELSRGTHGHLVQSPSDVTGIRKFHRSSVVFTYSEKTQKGKIPQKQMLVRSQSRGFYRIQQRKCTRNSFFIYSAQLLLKTFCAFLPPVCSPTAVGVLGQNM